MPMHLNSLTPMRISGTPRSFLNLDSRRPTPIEAVVIGGDLDSPLPILRVGLVSMNMLSSLSVVARSLPAKKVCGSAALKRLCISTFWIARNRPRSRQQKNEGRQVPARLADGERGDERDGGRLPLPRSLQSDAPAPNPCNLTR